MVNSNEEALFFMETWNNFACSNAGSDARVHSAPSSKTCTSLDFCVRRAKGGSKSWQYSSGNGSAADSGFGTGGGAQITAKNDLLSLHGKIYLNNNVNVSWPK